MEDNLTPQDQALIAAIEKNDLEEVKKQIQAGARWNAVEKEHQLSNSYFKGACPLHYVMRRDSSYDLAAFLIGLPGVNVNIQDAEGNTPLHILLDKWNLNNCPELTRLLIQKGADVNLKDKYGRTALFGLLSAYEFTYQLEVLKILLEAGMTIKPVEPELVQHFQESLLFKFKEVHDKKGKLEILSCLIDHGLQIGKLDIAFKKEAKKYLALAKPAKKKN